MTYRSQKQKNIRRQYRKTCYQQVGGELAPSSPQYQYHSGRQFSTSWGRGMRRKTPHARGKSIAATSTSAALPFHCIVRNGSCCNLSPLTSCRRKIGPNRPTASTYCAVSDSDIDGRLGSGGTVAVTTEEANVASASHPWSVWP